MKKSAFTLLMALLLSSTVLSPLSANENDTKQLVLGAPVPLHFFGSSIENEATSEIFGIIPPCSASIALSYNSIPCIKSLQYRSKSSENWLDARLEMATLESLVETGTVQSNLNLQLTETRWKDNRWYLHGGSSSLWSAPIKTESGSGQGIRYLIEATAVSSVKPKTFSLTLVPVEITSDFSNNLSDIRKSAFRRLPFPEEIEYQISIKQSQSMQPLQYVSSRTKDADILNTAGQKVAVPEFVFRGFPQTHSVLSSNPMSCSDPLMEKVLGNRCATYKAPLIKIYPWDRSIIGFLEGDVIDAFNETSTIDEWSFQGGQDTSLIIDFVEGCGYSNVFSLVSTNAPVYHINPPRWDKSERTLSVKIANTHVNAASDLQMGYFWIALRLSSAVCMWGIESKSPSASVEVISEEGKAQQVSSSSIKIDSARDSIVISLAGFTYSSPEIKIRLSDTTNSPEVPKKIKGKPSKITCVKGKKIMKLTTYNLKCPAGYKRVK